MNRFLKNACFAALCAPLAAGAETVTALDDIVLSANRTPLEARRTGSSVSVVTAEDLERAGDIQLARYLARLPGVGLVQNGPLGTVMQLRMRGAASKYIAVYIDGVRVDDPSGIDVSFDFGALTTSDVARIEVLRGSQSALWGGSAVAGVINITTKTAQKDGLSQEIALDLGSSATASARYGATWRKGDFEGQVNLLKMRSDGFSAYDTHPRTKGLERDKVEIERLSFGAKYRTSETLTLGASAFVQRTYGELDDWGADATGHHHIRREKGARLYAEIDQGAGQHLFDLGYYRLSRDIRDGWPARYEGRRLSASYKGTQEISSALTLVYGAEVSREYADYSVMPKGNRTQVAGVYGQALWQLGEDLDVSLSLRQDHNSDFGTQPSARLAAAWALSPEWSLRAVASSGFLSPSVYQLFGDQSNGIGPNAGLTPEKSRNFELGMDYAGANLAVNATLFEVMTDNAITYCGAWSTACSTAIPAGFSNLYENTAGKTRRRGLELAARTSPWQGGDLSVSYTYTKTKTPTGAELARVPRHSASLTLDQAFGDTLSGSVTLQHVADRWEFPTGQDRYTLASAGLRYAVAPETALSLRVENLFDEEYQTVPDYGTQGRSVVIGLRHAF